jgi:DNA-binding CsgD family transcriptional regulator
MADVLVERPARLIAALARVLPRLDGQAHSVPELVSSVPELVCELGFDRAMISRVQDGIWYPQLMFIAGGDTRLAEAVIAAGNTRPARLEPGTPETDMLASGRPILVTGVRDSVNPGSVTQAMIKASGTRSYVAAPVFSGAHAVGMVHADCLTSGRDVDEVDRVALSAFASGLQVVLARCALHEDLEATRLRLMQLSLDLRDASGEIDEMPVVRAFRARDTASDDLMIQVGPPDGQSHQLPDTLTTRELEVLALLAAGCTNTAIARRLMIAEGTAKKHVFHVLRKLNVANRSEAVARWFRARENVASRIHTSE